MMKSITNCRKNKRFSFVLLSRVLAIMVLFAFVVQPKPAQAFCVSCNGADTCLAKEIIKAFHVAYEDAIMGYFSAEFQTYRDWLVDTFFKQQVLPALMKFTEQMSAVGMYQVFIFGTFLDAKHQLETQRLFQQLQFEAQRDYQPSDDFCWFGTNVRSLGASEELGKYNAIALGEMQMKRQLGSDNSGGAEESDMDKGNRWQHFTANHCDPDDGNRIEGTAGTGLQLACGGGGGGGGARSNNDVDYTRMIEEPRTINVAFDDGTLTDPEQDILSISSNLYGHDILTRKMDNEYLKNQEYQHLYLALRSVAAKRNVAQNSFNAIVGMKSSGTDGMAGASKTHDFLAAVMQELGVPAADITPMIGEQPSYYAQLEILAKKIYQNPDFYASLYDSPANVARKGVAIKAIELMLDRAIYESQLRQEMATSVLLSSRLRTQFKKVNKDMTGAGGQ